MKKLYRTIVLQLTLAMWVFGFIACQEYNIDSQPEAPLNTQIDALDSYTVLATSPSGVVFNISSNTPWTIDVSQQWCKPSPSMSAASSLVSEVVVTMEPNETAKQRTATLTIKADGIEQPKVITIVQVSKENLVVIPYDEMVATEGGEISFNIISNKPWEIIPSTQFLENIDKTSGVGNEEGLKEKVTITVSANSAARRSGNITVKTAFEEYTFSINQDGVVIEQEEPTESGTIDFNASETEKVIKIRANKEWEVKIDDEYKDWIAAEKLSNSELKIMLKESNRLITRRGRIILRTTEIIPGFEGVGFTVTQKPNFWFDVRSENFIVDEATGNVKISQIGNNSVISNYAFKKGHLVFEFAELNLTEGARLVFNMWPNAGNTNFHFWLRSDKNCQFTCGGGFEWQQLTFGFTTEEVNAIRKIEFFVEDDPDNAGKLQIRLMIDGKEMGTMKNKTNVYGQAPGSNPGQIIYMQLADAPAGNYFTVKSITRYPVE